MLELAIDFNSLLQLITLLKVSFRKLLIVLRRLGGGVIFVTVLFQQ